MDKASAAIERSKVGSVASAQKTLSNLGVDDRSKASKASMQSSRVTYSCKESKNSQARSAAHSMINELQAQLVRERE